MTARALRATRPEETGTGTDAAGSMGDIGTFSMLKNPPLEGNNLLPDSAGR